MGDVAGDALSVVEVEVAFGPTRVLRRLSLDLVAGEQRFMVDHPHRIAIGEAVGIGLPAAALHRYPPEPAGRAA